MVLGAVAVLPLMVGCCSWAMAHCGAEWSISWHSEQNVPVPAHWPNMVVAWRPGWIKFQRRLASSAACWRKSRSYSSQPWPLCLIASFKSNTAYVNQLRVTRSVVLTAVYMRRQAHLWWQQSYFRHSWLRWHHEYLESQRLRASSKWWHTAVLSPSKSLISTKHFVLIRWTVCDGTGRRDTDRLRSPVPKASEVSDWLNVTERPSGMKKGILHGKWVGMGHLYSTRNRNGRQRKRR